MFTTRDWEILNVFSVLFMAAPSEVIERNPHAPKGLNEVWIFPTNKRQEFISWLLSCLTREEWFSSVPELWLCLWLHPKPDSDTYILMHLWISNTETKGSFLSLEFPLSYVKGFVLCQMVFIAPCLDECLLIVLIKVQDTSLKGSFHAVCTEISESSLVIFNLNK